MQAIVTAIAIGMALVAASILTAAGDRARADDHRRYDWSHFD